MFQHHIVLFQAKKAMQGIILMPRVSLSSHFYDNSTDYSYNKYSNTLCANKLKATNCAGCLCPVLSCLLNVFF
ncbi:hypothetical protein CVD19_09550 [Bacillus sp. T33-2]|nr:hypothetical protein CVD19_09550 [Bacillus sp. T33-2]